MIDFVFYRSIIKIREMAFCGANSIDRKKCDVIYLHSSDETNTLLNKNINVQKQYTIVNDLTYTIDNILSKINKNCRAIPLNFY